VNSISPLLSALCLWAFVTSCPNPRKLISSPKGEGFSPIPQEGESLQSSELHEPESIILHRVVVEQDIGRFFTDLLSQGLKFFVRVGLDIVGSAVKPEIVEIPVEWLVFERIDTVNQIQFFTKAPH
jgi:hypothetical protein